jgi:IS5 family transposase
MRIRSQRQLYFKPKSASYGRNAELTELSKILEKLPEYSEILRRVQNDLNPRAKSNPRGRKGMSAEQVFRSLLLRSRFDYSYRALAESTEDSFSARDFLKISPFSKGFKCKTLQSNIKLLKEETLDFVDEAIKRFAESTGLEDGQTIRTDGFTTESNIHYPTDWSLMNDSIRVLSRILTRAYEDLGVPIKFTNHYRGSKKKLFKINNSKSPKKRQAWNLELIRLCRNTIRYSKNSLPVLENFQGRRGIAEMLKLEGLISELQEFIPLAEQVLEQAYRRIVRGEKVPADEKLYSIFETHADIIVKGQRDVVFGHKSTITTGKSGLILDVDIHQGNPADSTLVKGVIQNHKNFYGRVPKRAVFDGCYSSNENRNFAELEGVSDVCFSKETDQESSCSRAVRRALRFFRAGIEATVSMLKRMFGLTRVMDKGFHSFRKAVKAATLSYNLFILSRMTLKS